MEADHRKHELELNRLKNHLKHLKLKITLSTDAQLDEIVKNTIRFFSSSFVARLASDFSGSHHENEERAVLRPNRHVRAQTVIPPAKPNSKEVIDRLFLLYGLEHNPEFKETSVFLGGFIAGFTYYFVNKAIVQAYNNPDLELFTPFLKATGSNILSVTYAWNLWNFLNNYRGAKKGIEMLLEMFRDMRTEIAQTNSFWHRKTSHFILTLILSSFTGIPAFMQAGGNDS